MPDYFSLYDLVEAWFPWISAVGALILIALEVGSYKMSSWLLQGAKKKRIIAWLYFTAVNLIASFVVVLWISIALGSCFGNCSLVEDVLPWIFAAGILIALEVGSYKMSSWLSQGAKKKRIIAWLYFTAVNVVVSFIVSIVGVIYSTLF